MIGRLLSVDPARDDKIRVVFECEDEAGQCFGPFIEHRPADDDPGLFVASFAVSLAGSLAAREAELQA